MSKPLIIFPFGGNAREALAIILANDGLKREWDVLGFIDDNKSTWKKEIGGIKVFGGKDILKKYPTVSVLAVPGNPDNYKEREKIIAGLKIKESRFATVIHPSVIVPTNAKIGYNSLVMPYVVLGSNVTIGNHCVILPNTTIGHDSTIDDYSCVGSNVSIAGSVTIKDHCYIGSGSNLRDGITMGAKSLVGLGSNVITNVKKEVVVAGNPAKLLK